MEYSKFLKKVDNGCLSDKGIDSESEGHNDDDSVDGEPEFGEVEVENDKEEDHYGDLLEFDSEKEPDEDEHVGVEQISVPPECSGVTHENSEFEKEYADHLREEDAQKMFPAEYEESLDPNDLKVGSKFMSKDSFYKHVNNYCIINKHQTFATKSTTKHLRVKCIHWRTQECPMFIYGMVKKGEGKTFTLRVFNVTHTCNGDKDDLNKLATPKYVVDWYYEKIKTELGINQPVPCPDDLANQFNKARKVNIRYHTAWRARVKVLENLHGSYEKSYSMVLAFFDMVKEGNPGSIATFSYGITDNTFLSVTICFKATIIGFMFGCRKIIGLDRCHLSGKIGGVMLHATGLDGQNGLVPLGIMICRHETIENWKIFLDDLSKLLGYDFDFTFISDKHKGILEAVDFYYTLFEHR